MAAQYTLESIKYSDTRMSLTRRDEPEVKTLWEPSGHASYSGVGNDVHFSGNDFPSQYAFPSQIGAHMVRREAHDTIPSNAESQPGWRDQTPLHSGVNSSDYNPAPKENIAAPNIESRADRPGGAGGRDERERHKYRAITEKSSGSPGYRRKTKSYVEVPRKFLGMTFGTRRKATTKHRANESKGTSTLQDPCRISSHHYMQMTTGKLIYLL